MPQVPMNINTSGYGPSLLEQKPSRTNLLMAASEMAQDAERSMPQGPERPRLTGKRKSNRPLKVMK